MYILIKDNVERIVDNEKACNQLISDGFKLLGGTIKSFEIDNEAIEEKMNLSDITLDELKTIAKEKGIEKYSSMKKADLVEIIEKLG